MRILRRGLDVSMIQGLLHELQVSCFPQKLGRKVVAVVVKPEVSDAGGLPDAFPCRFEPAVGDRVSLTLDQILGFPRSFGDIGEHHCFVMTAQGP